MESLRRFFSRNLGLKVTSVALAIALWGWVNGQQTTTKDFYVPITAVNVPVWVKTPVTFSQNRGHVSIRGPRDRLDSESLNMERLVEIQVDMKNLPLVEGPNRIEIGPGNVKFTVPLPELRLEVVGNRIAPSEATAYIEFNKWTVEIRPPEIEIPPDFKIAQLKVQPDQLLVAGPASLVNRFTEVQPRTLSLVNEESPGKFTQELEIEFDELIKPIREVDGVSQIEAKQPPKVTVSGVLEKIKN